MRIGFRIFSIVSATLVTSFLRSLLLAQTPAPTEAENEPVPREFQGFAEAGAFRGVIDDPDGYVNLRTEPRVDAAVVARVKANEPFSFERKESEKWCKVKLKSGVTGWMHYSRIKLFFTKDDLPGKPEPGDEIDKQASEQGVNYYEVSHAAAGGDKKALKKFFSLGTDGAAAEEHISISGVVMHLLGDDAFASFLQEQPARFRKDVTFGWDLGATYPFDHEEYLRQHFPKSARLLLTD
ncbi:MAG: SH3 domain-containing protein [Verrucomicrobiota bacterium]|nr:SH3 domain-containing protein [Verrucomicrobiota bacterium]